VLVADQNAVENYQRFQVNVFARKPTSIACCKELLTIHVQRRRYKTWVDHLIGQGGTDIYSGTFTFFSEAP
jgi:hypothetical protein